MTRRKKGRVNQTELLQAKYRNFRWGRPPCLSILAWAPRRPVAQGTPVRVDPKRRAKYRRLTDAHRRILTPRY